MKVRVKFFAILRERAGTAEVIQELSEGATVAELWRGLQQDFPSSMCLAFGCSTPSIRIMSVLTIRCMTATRWCSFLR